MADEWTVPTAWMAPCGCGWFRREGQYLLLDPHWKPCPLHAAAEEMRDFIRKLVDKAPLQERWHEAIEADARALLARLEVSHEWVELFDMGLSQHWLCTRCGYNIYCSDGRLHTLEEVLARWKPRDLPEPCERASKENPASRGDSACERE